MDENIKKVISKIFDTDDDDYDWKRDGSLKSIYNTPIIHPIKFEAGEYIYEYNTPDKARDKIKKMEDFWLPATSLVDFHREKIMTKTNTLKGNTIKEVFGFDDWEITIRMLCINEYGRTAKESRDLLIEWSNLRDSINVFGSVFNRKNIYNIIIEEINIKSIEGHPDVIPIELKCLSDEPNLFIIQEGEHSL